MTKFVDSVRANIYNNIIAGMEKQVYSSDLKSDAERHAGSTPATRTKSFSPGGEMVDTLALGASAARHGGSSPLPRTDKIPDGDFFVCGKQAELA